MEDKRRGERIWSIIPAVLLAVMLLLPARAGAAGSRHTHSKIVHHPVVRHVTSRPHSPHRTVHVNLPAKMDAYFQGLTRDEYFSGDVLVARNGQIILRKAYGMADMSRRIPNTMQTVFRIGSITKQFTALAILQLQQWGKLRVSDTVCGYLPRCPRAWYPITIYELLTHTSGIPDRFNDSDYDTTHAATPTQLLKRFQSKHLNFAPGTNYIYSNAGYGVLAYIISRVSGLSYAAYMQRYIFGPLHMDHSGVGPDGPALSRQAVGYQYWDTPAPYINLSTAFGFGNILTTADDLYTWDRALLSGMLVSRSALTAMFTSHVTATAANGYVFHYGYAWFIDHDRNHPVDYHPGLINGFASINEYLPADHVTIIILSNLQDTDLPTICYELRSMLWGK